MSYAKTKYTGPMKDRGRDDQNRALVSREELEDFRRQYGRDKTLRDLLNADRTGRVPSSSSDMRARGLQEASIAPSGSAEIPGAPANRPEPSPPSTMERMGSGLSDTAKKILAATGATAAAGAAGLGARALIRREAANRVADAERLASRVEPRMRRSGEGVEEAMKQARVEMAREPQLERARALSAAEKKAPAVQGDKTKMSPRSRTRDEEDVEFKRGGKVKTYTSGGSVRGAGIAQRGVRKCRTV